MGIEDESEKDEVNKVLSRRSFLKGGALVAASVAAGGLLAVCAPMMSAPAQSQESGNANRMIHPKVIADSEIKETATADVAVVGAGTAGLFAACAAAEAGAKAILLEKGSAAAHTATWLAAVESSAQKRLGIAIDRGPIAEEMSKFGVYSVDQRLLNLWYDSSTEMIAWFEDIARANGLEDELKKEAFNVQVAAGHYFDNPKNAILMPILAKMAQATGVDVRYSTPMKQLVRKDTGRVTGLIAKNANSDYLEINANTGVILATGCACSV